jgi:hypothetical protein
MLNIIKAIVTRSIDPDSGYDFDADFEVIRKSVLEVVFPLLIVLALW